jgi:endonuclease G
MYPIKAIAALAIMMFLSPGISLARSQFTQISSEYSPGALTDKQAQALYSPRQLKTTFDSCLDHFPSQRPIDIGKVAEGMRAVALCSDHFAVLYSQTSKTPVVVIERLTSEQLSNAKGEPRTNQFYADPRLHRAARAELSDYQSQIPAVDRGHMAPAADAPNQRAMGQSFALSNMVPQDPTNNRKIWSKVEADVRKYAQRSRGNVFVFTGPIFGVGYSTVGLNKVWKPTHLFKLVYDESLGRAWAYILPNTETRIERPMDYATFVSRTGMSLLDGLTISGSINRP